MYNVVVFPNGSHYQIWKNLQSQSLENWEREKVMKWEMKLELEVKQCRELKVIAEDYC